MLVLLVLTVAVSIDEKGRHLDSSMIGLVIANAAAADWDHRHVQ